MLFQPSTLAKGFGSSGSLGTLLSTKFHSLQLGGSLRLFQAAMAGLLVTAKENGSYIDKQLTKEWPRGPACSQLDAHHFGNAPPSACQPTGQRQQRRVSRPSLPSRSMAAQRSYWHLAAPALPTGQQGRVPAGASSGVRNSSQSACSSSPASGSQTYIESILAGAGLDPAELQRENPTAFSLLTLPLARVLAEVQADRLTRGAGRILRLHPAQLMARICFLSYDVGLVAEQIRARYGRNTDLLRFDLEGAQQLLAWLQSQQVSNSQLQIAAMSYPRLWTTDVGAAHRSKQHVQQRLGVTDSQWAEAFTRQTNVLAARPEVVDGVIAWLEAEPLGFSRAEVTQLWRSSPQLLATPAATLQHKLQRLLSRCPLSKQQLRYFMRGNSNLLWLDCAGLLGKLDSLVAELPGLRARLARLLVLGGTALNLETEVLLGKTSCLLQYGFEEKELSRMILQNPMILTCSWDGKLQPMLTTLEAVLGSQQTVVAAVSKAPDLLCAALGTIKDNFRALKQLGLLETEVRHVATRQSQLLKYKIGSTEFQATLRYFEVVLGRPPREMLLQYPSYLKSCLRRIDYKVSFMEHKEGTHYKASLTWVNFSDEKFCQHYKYSLVEFKAWEGQWLRSERAREYGLDKARVPGMRRALAARQKGRKAQVEASRKQRLAEAGSNDDLG